MEILSWNVNGIRAVMRKGFLNFLKNKKPDVVCLQEIKISKDMVDKEKIEFPGYKAFWNNAQRPGYSGTLILVKEKMKAKEELKFSSDNEGRVQAVDIGKFILVNIYFPHANHEFTRLPFKLKFNDEVFKYLKKLEKKKPLIVGGDFNVAHEEIDLARPRDNVGNPGFTDEERTWMTKILKKGFLDSFRFKNPEKSQYSWWSYKFSARERNIGWRIDYILVSDKIKNQIKSSFILDKIPGSDHCPVGIRI